VFVLALGTALTLIGLAWPATKAYVGFVGVAIILCDVMWLTPVPEVMRTRAAKIQEQFDCDALQLRWNALRAGEPEPSEIVVRYAKKYPSGDFPSLRDWYPPRVDRLPIGMARLICQRSNCFWDADLRRRLSKIIALVFCVILALAVVSSIAADVRLDQFFILVLLPIGAVFKFGYSYQRKLTEAADRLDRLRSQLEKAWSAALLEPEKDNHDLCRSIQDEIFDHRKRNPLVPDVLFKYMRPAQEVEMMTTASQMIEQGSKSLVKGIGTVAESRSRHL
jgi:hypothetical protein